MQIQNIFGAAAHCVVDLLAKCDTERKQVDSTIVEFEDPSVLMEDPRKEAIDVLYNIKGSTTTNPFIS